MNVFIRLKDKIFNFLTTNFPKGVGEPLVVFIGGHLFQFLPTVGRIQALGPWPAPIGSIIDLSSSFLIPFIQA